MSAAALAHADEIEPSEATSTTASEPGEGDIVVTARKRAEHLQDVPISITALSEKQLETRGVTTVGDLAHAFPSFHYVERGNLQIEMTIRGIGGDARNIGIDSGVGMYIDGVYMARSTGYNSDLADTQQVEVLRGPQGTLFGKNAIAGVVSITTKKPAEEFGGFVYASYGNYNAFRTQAAINVPLSSSLFAKVSVATWDRDGYILNTFNNTKVNDENRRGGRFQLRYADGGPLEINFSIDATRDRRVYNANQTGGPQGAAAPYFTPSRFVENFDILPRDNRDMWGGHLTVDYSFGNGGTLTNILGYRNIKTDVWSDVDMLPVDLVHSAPNNDLSESWSEELRYVSPSNKPFRYVIGGYYFSAAGRGFRQVYVNGSLPNGAINHTSVNTKSLAGFLNADFDVTPAFTITGGIRYTHETKDGSYFQQRPNLNYDFPNLQRTDNNVSWSGSLKYKLSPNLSTYVTISRGFKSGGFNMDTFSIATVTPETIAFNPEKVTNYEIGAKGSLLDGAVTFSAAAYHIDFADKQVSQFIPVPGNNIPAISVTNAGKVRIRGFELESTIRPTEGLTITASLARVDAKYTSFDDAALVNGQLVSYTGKKVERSPDWTGSIKIDYTRPVRHGKVMGSVGLDYTGDTYFQPDNDPLQFQKGYALLNGRLAYESDAGWTVALWGKNITGKDYYTYTRIFSGLYQVVYGEPRTYGVEARFKF